MLRMQGPAEAVLAVSLSLSKALPARSARVVPGLQVPTDHLLKKFWIILIVLVVLVGLVFAAGKMFSGSGEVAPTAVRMEEVTRGELTEFVSAPGEIQAKSKVSISAKTAAQIIELPFEEGANVRKGDVLVRLDDTEMQARLRATMARRAGQA